VIYLNVVATGEIIIECELLVSQREEILGEYQCGFRRLTTYNIFNSNDNF
jgi:hypothetical protein